MSSPPSKPQSETLDGLLSLNNHLLSENKQLRDTICSLRKDNEKLCHSLLKIKQISSVSPHTPILYKFFRKPWIEV